MQASLPSPLRKLTCHMGSHSVTCHPADVTFPPLPQPKLVLDLATPEGCKAELDVIGSAAELVTRPVPERVSSGCVFWHTIGTAPEYLVESVLVSKMTKHVMPYNVRYAYYIRKLLH